MYGVNPIRISLKGKPTRYPATHKPCKYIKLDFVIPKEKKDLFKLFPKSHKSLGTVSACPKCGCKGALFYRFAYDSCIDAYERKVVSSVLRNLNCGDFVVNHYSLGLIRGKHRFVKACHFNVDCFDVLNGLLLHGRRIPETLTRVYMNDPYGRGYDVHGRQLWKEPVKAEVS
ncbi:MAG: hypothetical protein WC325_12400 [Candidatus Bathyarchaeia archaeon]